MKALSLSTRWFLWLSFAIALFCFGQVLAMVWLEVVEISRGDVSIQEEIAEITVLLSISACVFVLMLGGLRFILRRMIRPIRAIAESADRISRGHLRERIDIPNSSDEVGLLGSALNLAFDRYDNALERLERFAGSAAHQLRTPLAALRSMGEVNLQAERTYEESRECIASMLEVVSEMSGVVEKLLLIARLTPPHIQQHFKMVDLASCISEVLELYETAQREKLLKIDMHMAKHVAVSGDRALITQAIGNIVDNAIHFSPEASVITITLEPRDTEVMLRITNTGSKIPAAVLETLQPLTERRRADASPTGRLGLAIVSDIMEIHRGRMEIQSDDGTGTTVLLAWPLAQVGTSA